MNESMTSLKLSESIFIKKNFPQSINNIQPGNKRISVFQIIYTRDKLRRPATGVHSA